MKCKYCGSDEVVYVTKWSLLLQKDSREEIMCIDCRGALRLAMGTVTERPAFDMKETRRSTFKYQRIEELENVEFFI